MVFFILLYFIIGISFVHLIKYNKENKTNEMPIDKEK